VSEENQANEELTRYLFGEMAEEEQTQLEAHYFADPDKFAELCAWRDRLIDRYMSEELSPSLRERFEAGIENAWVMNERIRFAETLQEAIDARHGGAQRSAPTITRWQSLARALYHHRQDLFIVAIVALLAAVTLLIISRL
jgi:anti-sigma factor RsiW